MDKVLDQLVDVVTGDADFESYVRALLKMLERVSGLESTYLTTVDLAKGIQSVLYARNTDEMRIPEGLEVPWEDTLCRRSLEEGVTFTSDVEKVWSDSSAARDLGIKTYLSQPVYVGDSELYGTLCGASTASREVTEDTRRLLALFARLVAHHIERERLMEALRLENAEYARYAMMDPLTGIANRRSLMSELDRALSNIGRIGGTVLVAFIDLDGFKTINDERGHDVGDLFLMEMSRRLSQGLRQGDFVARYGGDEFVVFAYSEHSGEDGKDFVKRLESLTRGVFELGEERIDYAGPSIGAVAGKPGESAQDLISRADGAMYQVKKQRKGR
ncbi:MAG: sensor domain-containing diguanylate cyclase [Pseudomonadota bacterium]